MKIIHVNRQNIAMNAKDGGNRQVYIVREGSTTRYAREVIIHGPSKMIYDGSSLRCGAKAWIETDAEVTLIDETTFKETRSK